MEPICPSTSRICHLIEPISQRSARAGIWRSVDLKAWPVTARGPELNLGPGPLHAQAQPGPIKAVSKGFFKLFNTMMNLINTALFNEFVCYLLHYITSFHMPVTPTVTNDASTKFICIWCSPSVTFYLRELYWSRLTKIDSYFSILNLLNSNNLGFLFISCMQDIVLVMPQWSHNHIN